MNKPALLKKAILTILFVALCSGCGKEPVPAGRLQQPEGGLSYITPDGWFRTKLAGVDFIIVSTNADCGIKPNIFIEEVLLHTQLSGAVTQITEENEKMLREFKIDSQNDFETQSGLRGIKIHAHHKTKQDLPITTFRYLIQDAERIISITCTSADAVKSKYEPAFDKAMKSLQSEKDIL